MRKIKNLYGVLCTSTSKNTLIYVGTFDSEFKWSSQKKEKALVNQNIFKQQYGLVSHDKKLFMIGGLASDESLLKSVSSKARRLRN